MAATFVGKQKFNRMTNFKLKIFYCLSAVTLLLIVIEIAITGWTEKKTDSRPFVFLTQTEQCLPSELIANLGLNTRENCRCDVIVLSYQKACRDSKTPSHVHYLFDNTATWRTGRNTLFFIAIQRNLDYIYYIFTDDDVSLKFNRAATRKMRRFTPIQIFQNWLLDYGPAVGVVDYEEAKEGRNVRRRKRKICGAYNKTSITNPTIKFDPLFNAFHANAVRHIFPLENRREKFSWWLTLRHVASNVELKFRGQALLFFPVTVENALHRSYPRSLEEAVEAWREYIENVQRQAPPQYAEHSLFKKYKNDPIDYVETSRTYCMHVTRHQSIIPFSHFAQENDS